jgi:hypothetical protein
MRGDVVHCVEERPQLSGLKYRIFEGDHGKIVWSFVIPLCTSLRR